MNENSLIKELKSIRSLSINNNRKRRNESDRDFLIRISGCRCSYCRKPFPKSKLSIVKRNPDKDYLSKLKNGIVACNNCANEKGPMSDRAYRAYLNKKKKEVRQEVYDNYPELRDKVFEKYNYECIYCVYEFGKSDPHTQKTIDHKIPVAKGGTNDLNNLCCACKYHNFDKRDLTTEEYFKVLDERKIKQKLKQL